MMEAAAGAAKIHWNDFRTYAEQEFKRLAEAGACLEADYIADVAAAERQQKAANREKLKRKAKLRAELAFDSLRLASEGVVTAAKADAKIAAQDAINAALTVLRTAVNKSVGIALL
jgi:membrane protein involved in colicin uptake